MSTENLNPVLRAALHTAPTEGCLSPEKYQAELRNTLDVISQDYVSEVKSVVSQRQEAAVANGVSAATVDIKSVELELLKNRETAIIQAGKLITLHKQKEDMRKLFDLIRPLCSVFPKARMAKITRSLIDAINQIPDSRDLQVDICLQCIAWCKEEKRTFLKHRIETKLAGLYQEMKKYQAGLGMIPDLLREVKKLDDKLLLVEIHLVEAKLHFSVRHIQKAKAALTSAKTNANAIHCPPLMQAEMDMVAGALHAEEGDFKTAYSYFYESFEAFSLQNDNRAVQALKYMMLCKIMINATSDITNVGRGTAGLKYLEDQSIQCLINIAKAHQDRSLADFEKVISENKNWMKEDIILSRHIDQAYEQLLQQSILKVVEPYSEVEVRHIAMKTNLPVNLIEQKLSQMILDKKTCGTLDQQRGVFISFPKAPPKRIYGDAVEIFETLSSIVTVLSAKVQSSL